MRLCIPFCKNCVYTKAHLAPKKRDYLRAPQKSDLQSVAKNKINHTLRLDKNAERKKCVCLFLFIYIIIYN